MTTLESGTRSRLGQDLEEAFVELSAYLRGEVDCESYDLSHDILTPERVQAIRRTVASSTKTFERRFGISSRTLEAYEQGRRRPDAAMQALLRVIERESDAVRRAFAIPRRTG